MSFVKMKADVRPTQVRVKISGLSGIEIGRGVQVARGDTTNLYEGAYEVVPAFDTQTLPTRGCVLQREVTVHPMSAYAGPYEVDPSAHEDITLATRNLAMRDDITVNKIYYAEVSNLSNGVTAYIAEHE